MSYFVLVMVFVATAGIAWMPRFSSLATVLFLLVFAGCSVAEGSAGGATFAVILATAFGWLGYGELRERRRGPGSC